MGTSRFALPATVCGLYLLFAFLQDRLPAEKLYMVLGGVPLTAALLLVIRRPFSWVVVHCLRALLWTAFLGLGMPALFFFALPWAESLTPPLINIVLKITPLSPQAYLFCQGLLPVVMLLAVLGLALHILNPMPLFPPLPRSGLALCALSGLHRFWMVHQNLHFTWQDTLPLTSAALLTALFLYLFRQTVSSRDELPLYVFRMIGTRRQSVRRFEDLVVRILTQVALADKRVSQAEADVILDFFQYQLGYGEAQLERVKKRIQRPATSAKTLDALLNNFRKRFPATTRLALLEQAYAMAAVKVSGAEPELALIRHIADMLEISEYNHRRIRERYFRPETEWDDFFDQDTAQENEAFFQEGRSGAQEQQGQQERAKAEAQALAVLGLEPGASMALIRKTYHQMVMEYHPDKVAHLGEVFKRVADEKMKELNAAYELLKQRDRK